MVKPGYHACMVNLLVFSTLIIFLGMFFPYGVPLFSIVLVFTFLLSFIRISDYRISFTFIVSVVVPLVFLYVTAMLLTGMLYKRNVYNVIDICTMSLLFFLYWNFLDSKRWLEYFERRFLFLLFLAGSIFALLGLLKFFILLLGVKIPFFINAAGKYPWGTSLKTDYNVYARGLIFAGISGYFFLIKEKRYVCKWVYFVMLLVIGTAVTLSGSRSSLVYGGILAMLALLKGVLWLNRRVKRWLINFSFSKRNARTFIMFLFVLIILFLLLSPQFDKIESFTPLKKIQKRMSGISYLISNPGEAGAFDPRLKRWNYAITLYDSYSLPGKLIGKGFRYLTSFGLYTGAENGIDYPHNLFFSFLLSNGILGLIIILLYLLFIFVISLRLHNRIYTVFFLLSFFIKIISGDQVIGSGYFMFFLWIIPFLFLRYRELQIQG